MKKTLALLVTIAVVMISCAVVGMTGCSGTGKEEQAFIDAVKNIGEVNENSYQEIKDAYSLFENIDRDRQEEIARNGAESFTTLKQSNVKLFDMLADKVPDTFEPYLSSGSGDWTYPVIKANIPDEVLKEFCGNQDNREALKKADEVHDWLADGMEGRTDMFEYWRECNQKKYNKILHYSSAVEYYDKGGSSSTSSNSSSEREAEDLRKRRAERWEQIGDDFFERNGYYPEG